MPVESGSSGSALALAADGAVAEAGREPPLPALVESLRRAPGLAPAVSPTAAGARGGNAAERASRDARDTSSAGAACTFAPDAPSPASSSP
jgi:hypothetical protein